MSNDEMQMPDARLGRQPLTTQGDLPRQATSPSAHTPGPWAVEGWEIVKRDGNPGHVLIADLDYAACGDNEAEVQANARLIAAVPELLAALKAIHQSTRDDEKGEQWTIRAFLNSHGMFNDDIASSRRLVAEACSLAIAKAEPPNPLTVPRACATCGRQIFVLVKHADDTDLRCGVCAEGQQ